MRHNQKTKSNTLPANGASKVYYKNLLQLFKKLQTTNPSLHKIYFCNYLLQAKDVLTKLQKSDPLFDCQLLLDEYYKHEKQFLDT